MNPQSPDVPHVVYAVAYDGAAREPGINAARAFRHINNVGLPTNLAIGDRAFYANARPEKFHDHMGAMGFKPVTDYKVDQLGVQDSYRGAIMVDGWWYCECLPEKNRTASRDFRNGDITEAEYNNFLTSRKKFAATRKARPDGNGTTRWAHPRHLGHRCKGKDLFCTRKSLSIPVKAGQKYAQEYHFQSEEWLRAYAMRNTVESANARIKRSSTYALGDPERRRLRGRTSQFLLAALVVMASNIAVLLEARKLRDDPEHRERIDKKKARRRQRPYADSTANDELRSDVDPSRVKRE